MIPTPEVEGPGYQDEQADLMAEDSPIETETIEETEEVEEAGLTRELPLLVIDQELLDTYQKYHYESIPSRGFSMIDPETPVPDNLAVIADTLYEHRLYLAELDNLIQVVERVIDELKITMIPDGGWPGPNEKARKQAGEKAILENQEYQVTLDFLQSVQRIKKTVLAVIASAENARRALEYSISFEMVRVLKDRASDQDSRSPTNQLHSANKSLIKEETAEEAKGYSQELEDQLLQDLGFEDTNE